MINEFLFSIDLFLAEYYKIYDLIYNSPMEFDKNVDVTELDLLFKDMIFKAKNITQSGVLELLTASQRAAINLTITELFQSFDTLLKNSGELRFIRNLQLKRNMCKVAFAIQKQD